MRSLKRRAEDSGMRWFKRNSKAEPEATDEVIDWAARRREPMKCAGCQRANPPYVYAENGKDYCVDCAKKNFDLLRLKPAGKRDGDLTLTDVLEDDQAS
jgi:hypothetical protein